MPSSAQGHDVLKYSCRCLNVSITARKTDASNRTEPDYERAFVGEDGIHIIHHYLTLRTRNRAQRSTKSLNKLVQHLALSCLACKTLVYRVAQEISPEAEAREGPVVPTEDWVEQETLRSKDGWVEVFVGPSGCLVGNRSIEQHLRSIVLSKTFSIGVLSPPPTPTPSSVPTSSPLQTFPPSSRDGDESLIPAQILPSLPPLFPPPPFTPSHPVFVSLSSRATDKSTELRLRVEEETRRFIESQLEVLEKEESRLRIEVEGIWRGYREGWKEVLGKFNEERRQSVAAKPEGSAPTASAKSGVPMSIRDFSPIVRSHPRQSHPPSRAVLSPSPSLLSTSLAQSGAHLPSAGSQYSEPAMSTSTTTPGRALHSSHPSLSHVLNSSDTPRSPQANGARSSGSSSSISIKTQSDSGMPGAFRRNMDTNVDIASSVAWAKGEEEMRRRLGGGEEGETRERARKRTSKNLGIGAVETTSSTNTAATGEQAPHPASIGRVVVRDDSAQQSGSRAVARSGPDPQIASPYGGVQSPKAGSLQASGTSRKAKRRVTFDVQPEAVAVQEIKEQRPRKHVDEVELFDLDDLSSTEAFPESELHRPPKPARPQPVTRTPSYKLRTNDGASSSRPFQPASMPVPRTVRPRSPVNGSSKWPGGSARKSVGLADALPLLSSSVPAGDRIFVKRAMEARNKLSQAPRTPSPPAKRNVSTSRTHAGPIVDDARSPSPAPPSINGTVESSETELKNLLAASAPSHRHAWREGGRAWEMFNQRSRDKKRAKGAIAEEESDVALGSPEESSEGSSDEESVTRGPWRNPSQFASSLPVQIHPLVQYKPSLEPKTSLADKQGVLVPPLKATNSRPNSATAFRKAAYAERDRIRLIDPGPTLDFNEEENEEDDLHEEVGDGGRGRRHALSILQARSVVPEAGMWRSMAS